MNFSPVTLGRRVKSLEVESFVFTEASNLPLTSFPPHAHELASITFVLKGSGVETIGASTHECSRYSTIIKPAEEVHSNKYGRDGLHSLIIEAKPERLQCVRSYSQILERAEHIRQDTLIPFAMRIYREFRIADSAASLSLEGLVLEVLGQSTRRRDKASQSAPPRWLVRARDLCHEQFTQSISLGCVASSVGVHPAHLARMFRSHYQCTVGEYVRRLRLDYAAQELTRTDRPVIEIAASSGFYDQSHFTHAFKLQTGLTPTEYRSEAKKMRR